MSKLAKHLYKTADVLDRTSSRMDISLLALNWIVGEDQQMYYSTLDKADVAHNMDDLFTELRTIHSMLYEELNELIDCRLELSRGDEDSEN